MNLSRTCRTGEWIKRRANPLFAPILPHITHILLLILMREKKRKINVYGLAKNTPTNSGKLLQSSCVPDDLLSVKNDLSKITCDAFSHETIREFCIGAYLGKYLIATPAGVVT
ncbi:hypothetical protein JTE90_028956 [Oedothorax gibbosus]|uniref:Uncharacterized protein n=1 Tax=Oedothorax gibbosus TaxID=931172 RepID=A0AAV6VHH2_9ARAC|nr:hypothetical protein JTE90_028956 [Oedothorax gibbosus]